MRFPIDVATLATITAEARRIEPGQRDRWFGALGRFFGGMGAPQCIRRPTPAELEAALAYAAEELEKAARPIPMRRGDPPRIRRAHVVGDDRSAQRPD